MNETRDLLERVGDRFAFPDQAFERLERRRDRKRRNRRIAAGAAGIAVFAALVFALARATWSDSAPRPGEPPPSPTPSIGIERSGNPILRANEVVVDDHSSIEAVDRETLARRTLVACKDPCVFFSGAAASADDGWLAYTIETCLGALPCEADAGLWVANDLGERRQLIQSCDPDQCFPLVWAWSPTSATLAIAGPAGAPSGPGRCSSSIRRRGAEPGSRTRQWTSRRSRGPPTDRGSPTPVPGTSTSFPSTVEHRRCWRRGATHAGPRTGAAWR